MRLAHFLERAQHHSDGDDPRDHPECDVSAHERNVRGERRIPDRMDRHGGDHRREEPAILEHVEVERPSLSHAPQRARGDRGPHDMAERREDPAQADHAHHPVGALLEEELQRISRRLERREARADSSAEAHAVEGPSVPRRTREQDHRRELSRLLDEPRDRRTNDRADGVDELEQRQRQCHAEHAAPDERLREHEERHVARDVALVEEQRRRERKRERSDQDEPRQQVDVFVLAPGEVEDKERDAEEHQYPRVHPRRGRRVRDIGDRRCGRTKACRKHALELFLVVLLQHLGEEPTDIPRVDALGPSEHVDLRGHACDDVARRERRTRRLRPGKRGNLVRRSPVRHARRPDHGRSGDAALREQRP